MGFNLYGRSHSEPKQDFCFDCIDTRNRNQLRRLLQEGFERVLHRPIETTMIQRMRFSCKRIWRRLFEFIVAWKWGNGGFRNHRSAAFGWMHSAECRRFLLRGESREIVPVKISAFVIVYSFVTVITKSYQIEFDVIALLAAGLNVMDLKVLHAPARLATPAVSPKYFMAALAICFRLKLQPWSLGSQSNQSVTCTSSRSCLICDLGRPSTSRVNEGRRAS